MMSPSQDQIRAARLASGLSQNQAAELIKASPRSWENWEQGRVKMHPGLFDYFLIKTKKYYTEEKDIVEESIYPDCKFIGKWVDNSK